MKTILAVLALVAMGFFAVDASAQRSVVRVNGPGIGNRTVVRTNGFNGANVNVNGFRGANVNVNGFNNGFNNVNVNSFRRGTNVNVNGFGGYGVNGFGVNNFGAFAVTRPVISSFNYAPPIAVQSFGVPVISSYGGFAPVGIQSYGYQVQGVGFANPGCGRLLLGY